MLSKILSFFKSEEDYDPSFIRLTRNILIFVLLVNIALIPLVTGLTGETSRNPRALITLSITLVLEAISFFYVLRGKIRMAKAVVPLALIAAVVVISFTSNGLKNGSITGLPIILVISAILLGKRSIYFVAPLTVAATILIAYYDLNQKIRYVPVGLDDAIILPILLIGCAGIIQLLTSRLNDSVLRARKSEELQRQENIELQDLRASLEERVNKRTAELDNANQNNEKRAKQFEAVAQVARAISSIQDLDSILPRITQVISEQFGHYHTGIFLLDENREFAILRAANSEGGRSMLKNMHKLLVGQTGIVGYVTATGQPRIVLDVGSDAVYFDNPYLPNTHSEIALPLRIAGQIIGALDVQSEASNAFTEDDIEVLSTLADQVSIAIQNARTLEEARKSLAEAQSAFGQLTQESWKVMRPETVGLGFQLSDHHRPSFGKPLEGSDIQEALTTGETIITKKNNKTSTLTIPIRLRNEVIGVMNLKTVGEVIISQDEIDIAEAISERLSLAIESATLLRTTQRRADIEKITTDISSKVSSSTRFETIVQTAAQELSRALGGEVIVQIEPIAMKMDSSLLINMLKL
ncbi:MAG: GAF domain-containing protein [Lewinellaceae bacterium]|nr:GAF domain-containing protein [Lewinellaceae bacterium]